MKESVILVNEHDQMFGTMDKLAAHLNGQLHRAISVFIFNSKGELLLQERAPTKYHSGGKWTNTCCSHPKPGEVTADAAHRRLREEMGIACELGYWFNFTYRAEMDNDITEHEFDHVFFGITNDAPVLNPIEATGFRYIKMDVLANELRDHPEYYSKWLSICFEQVMKCYSKIFNN